MLKTIHYKFICYALCSTVAICLLCGCHFISFEELSVTVHPDNESLFFTNETITVTFSIEPDKMSAEQEMKLTQDKSAVSCTKSWDGNTCFISPTAGWQKGSHYSFCIDGPITLTDGRMYTVYERTDFLYGVQDDAFLLQEFQPAHHGEVSTNQSLQFTFNTAIDEQSFIAQFSLSPYASYKIRFSKDKKTAFVIPESEWPCNTFFSWTLEPCRSADNYILSHTSKGTFSTITDTEAPVIVSVCPAEKNDDGSVTVLSQTSLDTLYGKQPVAFTFSKAMNTESIEDAIQFQPQCNGIVCNANGDDKTFIFIPTESYTVSQRYVLSVLQTAADTHGLHLYQAQQFNFTSRNEYLRITSIKTQDGILLEQNSTIEELQASDSTITFLISFSTAISEDYRQKTTDAISVSAIFPSSADYASCISAKWNATNTLLILEYKGFSEMKSDGTASYYELTCTGGERGITNSAGAYMEDDVCVVFSVH